MMYPPSPSIGMHDFVLFGLLHVLVSAAFAVGVFFLLAYAVREWRPLDLRRYGLWLVGGSVLVFVLMGILGSMMRFGWHGGERCPFSPYETWNSAPEDDAGNFRMMMDDQVGW